MPCTTTGNVGIYAMQACKLLLRLLPKDRGSEFASFLFKQHKEWKPKEVLSCDHLRDLIQSYSLVLELLYSDLANKDELRKYYFLILLKKSTSAPCFFIKKFNDRI